jgi:hypothetical protein
MAHSNWMELCLVKMGYKDVYCFIGENVRVESPSGEKVPPLTTGTFGGDDALHSMIGEGADKLVRPFMHQRHFKSLTAPLQAELGISDLSEELLASKTSSSGIVKKLFEKIVAADDTKDSEENKDEDEEASSNTLVDKLQALREKTGMDGEAAHKAIVGVLKVHDILARRLSGSTSWNNSSGVLKTFIMATLEPLISPILTKIAKCKSALFYGSA